MNAIALRAAALEAARKADVNVNGRIYHLIGTPNRNPDFERGLIARGFDGRSWMGKTDVQGNGRVYFGTFYRNARTGEFTPAE